MICNLVSTVSKTGLQNNLPIQTILMHNLPNEVEEQLVMGLMNRLLEESAL
jgi:hypothetical protein